MKNLLSFILFFSVSVITIAQTSVEKTKYCEEVSKHLKNQDPFNDFDEASLKSVDSIADFETQINKIKITGTVFLADGITPAKDVIIFIQQADHEGEYALVTDKQSAYVKNRLWVKTNNQGQYTIYTYLPGSTSKPLAYPLESQPKHIHAMIKEPSKDVYELSSILFDSDPLVTKSCRKRLKRKNIDSLLELKTEGDMQVAIKNIVLESNNEDI